MTTQISAGAASDRLDRLLGFLAMDQDNPALLADAAEAAFEARRFGVTAELLGRHAALAPLPPALCNLAGLAALAEERFGDAEAYFEQLRRSGIDDPGVRFNQAWALAMVERYGEAAELLDDEVIAVSPRGPTLKLQALHHLGDLDVALAEGRALIARYPNDQALLGAAATLAMDADDLAMARTCAGRAPDSPQALAVLGMLALDASDVGGAMDLFDRALARQQGSPRALVGKGLALLAGGQAAAGARAIEAGAAHFRTHLGSWIAAGWAWLIAGDTARAQAMFTRVCEIDDTFSEGHGGLAVLALEAGDLAEAQRRSEIALRLDAESLGGILSRIMLLQAQGDTRTAARIRDIALATPVGPSGKTLLEALAGMNRKSDG
ncbi:MAG: tetratricopeptide repeat protein [Novosphingobium sp.]|jgi:tetratricopeptide (TPR) repeat protein|nr:tetratricopeptide repeat protein [Novosphingobium sp.]